MAQAVSTSGVGSEGWIRVLAAHLRGDARVWALNGAVGASAAILYFAFVRRVAPLEAPFEIPSWALAAMFCAAEIFVVHLDFRRDAHTFSMTEIPMVLGLFFASPDGLVLALLIGAAAALSLHRRLPAVKLAFNLAQFALGAGLAVITFHAIVALGDPLGPVGWCAAMAATLVALLVSDCLIHTAIRLSGGGLGSTPWIEVFALGLAATGINSSLALVAASLLWTAPRTAWLLVLPTAAAGLAYRAYSSSRERWERLGALHDTGRVLQESLDEESVLLSILSQARDIFQAELAEMTLFPAVEEGIALRTALGPRDRVEVMTPVVFDAAEGFAGRVLSEGRGILVARTAKPDARPDQPAEVRDAMVVPLSGEGRTIGLLLVGNRLGDVDSFDAEDLEVLETLADHIGMALEKDQVSGLRESILDLTEANRLKDAFVAMVSHELRTPMTVIQGTVKTLLRSELDLPRDERDSFLRAIERNAERLHRIIEDLLIISRIQSAEDGLEVSSVWLPSMVEQVVQELDQATGEHPVRVEFGTDLPLVATDESKVRQIVSNLIENACKYSPEAKPITVRGRLEADHLVISVQDEGSGIPEALHEKVFDRFFQVDGSHTRSVRGAGLGLFICRQLTQALRGRLWLEKSDENGSVFSLALPLVRGDGEADAGKRIGRLAAVGMEASGVR